MANLRITLQVDGITEFDRTFTRFTELIEDLREIWPAVMEQFYKIMAEQFAAEGKGRSGRWKPLSRRYAIVKARQYPGKTILRRTDRMKDSLVSRTKDSVFILERDRLTLGTRVFYAIFHQRGTRKMPARRMFDFAEPQRVMIQRAIHRALLKSTGRIFRDNVGQGFNE
jgi:phage gpG-like protein